MQAEAVNLSPLRSKTFLNPMFLPRVTSVVNGTKILRSFPQPPLCSSLSKLNFLKHFHLIFYFLFLCYKIYVKSLQKLNKIEMYIFESTYKASAQSDIKLVLIPGYNCYFTCIDFSNTAHPHSLELAQQFYFTGSLCLSLSVTAGCPAFFLALSLSSFPICF